MRDFRPIGAAAITLLCLASCATSKSMTLPSGEQGQLIRCGGAARTIDDCYAKAGEVCPKGYDVIDAQGEAHPFVVSGGSVSATGGAASGGYSTVGGSVVSRSLMVKCH